MSTNSPRLKTAVAAAARDPQRSTLFHWMVKNHKTLEPGLRAKRVNWAPLIEAAHRAGLKNDAGGTLVEQVVRRTWRKARAHVEAERKATTAREAGASPKPERKIYPRDMPKDWKPREAAVSPPIVNPSEPFAHLRALGPTPTTGPFVPEPDYTGMDNVERNIARVKWSIARNS